MCVCVCVCVCVCAVEMIGIIVRNNVRGRKGVCVGGGGGVTNKKWGIHLGSFFRESRGRGEIKIQFKEKQQKIERGYNVYLRG